MFLIAAVLLIASVWMIFIVLSCKPRRTSAIPQNPIDLKGKNIVISGNLFYYPSHEVLKKRLESLGAKVSRRISKKTDILIIGEDGTTGRIQDVLAEEQGICILLESELMSYL